MPWNLATSSLKKVVFNQPVYTILFTAILRLLLFVVAGYVLFRFSSLQEKHLNFLVRLTMNVFLPIYFIRNFIMGWDGAAEVGFLYMVAFFFGSISFLLIQIGLGKLVANYLPLDKNHRTDFMLLFSFHNAGYVALPIMESFAPPELIVFMFFWIFGFSTFFWIFSVPIITKEKGRGTFSLNGPLTGIIIGFLLSLTGLHHYLVPYADKILHFPAKFGLNLVLLSLGGVLASIPKGSFRPRREYILFIFIKLLAYPLVILCILFPLSPSWIPQHLLNPIKLALVLQASVPPSTNLMLATKRYGSSEQVAYIAGGEIVTYPASIITMPLVLTTSFLVLL